MSAWLERFRSIGRDPPALDTPVGAGPTQTGASGANGRCAGGGARTAGTGSHEGLVWTVLDGGGLPSCPCSICDGRTFWCPADAAPEWGAWVCAGCEPRPIGVPAHGCALPPGAITGLGG